MKFSINNFFSKCDQILKKLRIWSHLLKKSLIENFFCAVLIVCHSKNCEVHLICSLKQKLYCKNIAKSFWLIFKSKVFALIARFSVLIHAALLLLDLEKKVSKEVFITSNDVLYSE